MFRARQIGTCACVAVAMAATLMASTLAQDAGRKEADEKEQLVDGVITWVAAEKSAEGKTSGVVLMRLNTGVVWRDFVRDTATEKGSPPDKAAEKGDQSVATKGQPQDKTTQVEIEIPADTSVELRYRSEMDERSRGAPTPEEARELARRDPTAEKNERHGAALSRAARQLKPEELKQGHWVKVGYRRVGDYNKAAWVFVLEPVRDTASTANPREK